MQHRVQFALSKKVKKEGLLWHCDFGFYKRPASAVAAGFIQCEFAE